MLQGSMLSIIRYVAQLVLRVVGDADGKDVRLGGRLEVFVIGGVQEVGRDVRHVRHSGEEGPREVYRRAKVLVKKSGGRSCALDQALPERIHLLQE